MRIDFESDLKAEINKNFKRWGIKALREAPIDDYLLDYLSTMKKLVSSRRRVVKYSRALASQISNHPQRKAIEHIERLFTAGGNVNIFQSQRLIQTKFHDHLVYEWNIFHFHLSMTRPAGSIFVKQVNSLLFVYITDSEAVFLDVAKHSPGIFADVKWIEMLHDDFPDLIRQYEDIRTSEHFLIPELNSEDRQALWNKGYSIGMTKIRNKMYRNPGLGRMTSGHNIFVRQNADRIWVWLYSVKNSFEIYNQDICKYLGVDNAKAVFKLRFGHSNLEIIEVTTNQVVLYYPNLIDESLWK